MIYFLFYAWFRVRTYSEESEHEPDLLDMFEWVQSYVQAEVVNRTTVRFSVYEMMLNNCGSTNTVSFKNVPVAGKNRFCVGFAMEIVKCRKMTVVNIPIYSLSSLLFIVSITFLISFWFLLFKLYYLEAMDIFLHFSHWKHFLSLADALGNFLLRQVTSKALCSA